MQAHPHGDQVGPEDPHAGVPADVAVSADGWLAPTETATALKLLLDAIVPGVR